jgi:MFS family permease
MDNSRSGQQPSALHLSPPSRSIGGGSSITNRRTSLFTDGTSDGQKATVTRKHSLLISTSVLGRPMVSEFDMTPVMGLVNKRFSKSSQLGVGSPAPSLPPLEEAHPVPLMMLGDRSDGPSSWTMLKKLMCNGVFITTVNALAALYFVVTGIQFWVTPYCVTVLGAGIGATGGSFVAISATAPTIGVVFGGWITDKRGGYQGYEQAVKTLKLNLVFCFLAMVSCIMTTVFTTLGGVMPCITIMLFFGAAVVPSSTGIVIDAVEPEERAFSSAMSQMVCNILGYALSPFLSGFVAEYAGGPEGLGLKWGFRLVCWWGCFSFVFMVMAVWQASKRLNRDTKAKNIESKKRLKEEKAKKEDAEMEDEGDFEAEFEGGGKGWSSSLRGGLMRDASA